MTDGSRAIASRARSPLWHSGQMPSLLAGHLPRAASREARALTPAQVETAQRAERAVEKATLRRYDNIANKTFGVLRAVEYVGDALGSGAALWRCLCLVCGAHVVAATNYLRQHPPQRCKKKGCPGACR
jgi:hypothetical protein